MINSGDLINFKYLWPSHYYTNLDVPQIDYDLDYEGDTELEGEFVKDKNGQDKLYTGLVVDVCSKEKILDILGTLSKQRWFENGMYEIFWDGKVKIIRGDWAVNKI